MNYHNAQPEPPLIGTTHYFNGGWYYSGIIEGYKDGYAYIRVSDGTVKVRIENLNTEEPSKFSTSKVSKVQKGLTQKEKYINDYYN